LTKYRALQELTTSAGYQNQVTHNSIFIAKTKYSAAMRYPEVQNLSWGQSNPLGRKVWWTGEVTPSKNKHVAGLS